MKEGVGVTGVSKVDQAAVRRVDKIGRQVVVVEKRGDVVFRRDKKVVVESLDSRRWCLRWCLVCGCRFGRGRGR